MTIKETKSYSLIFSQEEVRMIYSLIIEQVGSRTIESILDEMNYVLNYYTALFTMFNKVSHIGNHVTFSPDEIQVLSNILSKAYNDGQHEDSKEMIKGICDAIDILRKY